MCHKNIILIISISNFICFLGSYAEKAEFVCVDGTKIKLENICNGAIDCPDKSDETKELCYHVICPRGMFRCHYGACIKEIQICDGKNECADNSDESQCGRKNGSCEKNEYRCQSGQCISLDKLCNEQEDCSDGSDEAKENCEKQSCPENTFRCKYGGCIHKDAICNGHQDCIDGSDESELLCKNIKCSDEKCNKATCPGIDITRIQAICKSKTGRHVPCDNPVPAGTKIKYECKERFVPVNKKHGHNNGAECQLDGTWNGEILKCQPECGKVETGAVSLVVKGFETKPELYPWHAVMYVLEDGVYTFWCGGTLISEKAVLTAGHCVWEVSPENIRIALGKYYSDFNKRQKNSVVKEIKRILIQPLYQDQTGNYGSDLAILEFRDSVKLSSEILPACIDWKSSHIKYQLQERSVGLAVGMGITENETFSDTLRATYLPVISDEICMRDQTKDFKKYITYTSFCAGWGNGTGVCNGDSGGGLLFQKAYDKSMWVLQGVVSVSPRKRGTSFCDPDYYTIFTKVGMYLDWIKKVLNDIHHNQAY